MRHWPAAVLALSALLGAFAIVIGLAASHSTTNPIAFVVPFVVMSGVGQMIVRKRPGNGVGLLLLVIGCLGTAWIAAAAYMDFAAEQPTLPLGARFAAWFASWVWAPLWMSITVLLLIFPTGAPVGRWKWALRLLLGFWGVTVAVLAIGLIPEPFEALVATADNSGLIPLYEWYDENIAGTIFLIGIPVGLASQFGRWRRGDPVERQQVKWIVFAAVLVLAALLVGEQFGTSSLVSELMWTAGLTALPIAVGVAVVRYRLYDIDRIVGRTISYAIVLGVLTLLFVAIAGIPVLALGTGEAPAWLVAASTLVVFTLFNPLRRRVQRVVDRRFNRLPYNPEQVTGALAESLRNEVAAPSIAGLWEHTARTALQPASSAIWVRDRG